MSKLVKSDENGVLTLRVGRREMVITAIRGWHLDVDGVQVRVAEVRSLGGRRALARLEVTGSDTARLVIPDGRSHARLHV